MSEYNIQMNKYNAINDEYDQLYPQPMKHANTHAEDGNDPITPSMIGTYTKTEIDTALHNKADSSSVYTKSESISAETRTALSIAETATPDAALAEIARQLSESGNVKMDVAWENASPSSSFAGQSINLDLSSYKMVYIVCTSYSAIVEKGCTVRGTISSSFRIAYRDITFTDDTKITFGNGLEASTYGGSNPSTNNGLMIPLKIYGIIL